MYYYKMTQLLTDLIEPVFGKTGWFPRNTKVEKHEFDGRVKVYDIEMENEELVYERLTKFTAITVFSVVKGGEKGYKITSAKSTHGTKKNKNRLEFTSYFTRCDDYKDGYRVTPKYIVIHEGFENLLVDEKGCAFDFRSNARDLAEVVRRNSTFYKKNRNNLPSAIR